MRSTRNSLRRNGSAADTLSPSSFRDFSLSDKPGRLSRYLHSQIVSQLLKFIGTSDKISFTVYFNHSANAPTSMDIGVN